MTTDLIGIFQIESLNIKDIHLWAESKGFPERFYPIINRAFIKDAAHMNTDDYFTGTLMIRPYTNDAQFVHFYPQGKFVEDFETESLYSKVIGITVTDYPSLKARANLLGSI